MLFFKSFYYFLFKIVSSNLDEYYTHHQEALFPSSRKEKRTFNEYSSPFHYNRIRMIGNALNIDNLEYNFNDIGEIIVNYEYRNPIEELYESIVDELKMTGEELNNLNFYNENFAIKLYMGLSRKTVKNDFNFLKDYIFYHDFSRLVFKWIIYIKERAIKRSMTNSKNDDIDDNKEDNLSNLESILKTLDPIIEILNSELHFQFSIQSFDFEFFKGNEKSSFIPSIIKDLINCEILERPDIMNNFYFILKEFYSGEIDCSSLKSKYFNGDFNSDLILKAAFYFHDPIGEAYRQCFLHISSTFDAENIPRLNIENIENTENTENSKNINYMNLKGKNPFNLEQIKFLKGWNGPEIVKMSLVSQFMIDYFMENNIRFKIWFSIDLVILLRKLEKFNLLPSSSLSSLHHEKRLNEIIEFYFRSHDQSWKEYFRESLSNELIESMNLLNPIESNKYDFSKHGTGTISKEEYQKYMNLIS